MNLKKVIISILLMFAIICINSQCFAKYVFEYNIIAAEITINK